MAGAVGGHEFLDSDVGSGDETFRNFCEHETIEDKPVIHFNPNHDLSDCFSPIELPDQHLGAESLEPYTGMTFPSLDYARDFYYEYAKRTGFTIRTNKIRHSLKNMAIIGRDFVCSREGFRAAKHTLRKDRVLPPRPITREGCKAMMRLAARDGGKWLVTKFVQEHNHNLMANSKYSGELPIVNILNEVCLSQYNEFHYFMWISFN